MQLVRGMATVRVRPPNADDTINPNGDGYGYTWRFREKDEDLTDVAVGLQPTWKWQSAGYGACEYIPALRACTIRGYAVREDMLATDWTAELQTWYTVVAASHPQRTFLWFPGGADTTGQIASNNAFYPNLAAWLYRAQPVPEQTELPYTVLGLYPETGAYNYAYYLPMNAQGPDGWKYPRLMRAPKGVAFDAAVHTIDEAQSAGFYSNSSADQQAEDYLCIENVGGYLLFWWNQGTEPWVYKDDDIGELPMCRIKLTARGHGCAFNIREVQYSTSAACEPYRDLTPPSWCNSLHEWTPIRNLATGTGVSVTSAHGLGNPSDAQTDKPRVILTSDGHRKPLVSHILQFHHPLWDSASDSYDDVDGQHVLLSASGSCNDSWRGATCELKLRVTPDQYTDWKRNGKVEVNTAWYRIEEGATTPTLYPTTPERQFTGYIRDIIRGKDPDDLGRIQLTLRCEDGITARLQGKRKMLHHAAYGGLKASAAVAEILWRLGVPDNLQDLSDIPDVYLPEADRPEFSNFSFGADYDGLAALDTIANALGMYFRVTQNGIYTFAYRPTYSGTPDFTISDTATEADELLYALEAERGGDEFRNYLAVIVGQGAMAQAAYWRDLASHATATSADYIGEAWWDVIIASDAGEANTVAQHWFAERFKQRQIIRWETSGKPSIWPNHYVAVTSTGLGVDAGTVFRVMQKDWTIEPNTGEYRCSFLGLKVQ